jgi:hypothetical protein
VTQLTTALANERTAKVKAVLDTAILQGRITAAERETWETKLKDKFDENVTALANEKEDQNGRRDGKRWRAEVRSGQGSRCF